MDPVSLPAPVRAALEALAAAGVRAALVGGALRDRALGRAVRDFDVVVEGALESARSALPGARFIDARQPILLVESGEARVEVSGLREGAQSLEQDLALRDFTVNAIAFDAARGELVDPLGGRRDLEARVLRAAGPRAFVDDPVRVLRGVRLALELDLTLEPGTRVEMERAHWRLAAAPAERRRDELYRLLALPRAADGIDELRRVGALAGLLPELLRGVGVEQGRHHCEDVYAHTLRVAGGVRPEPVLRLAALLHDVAKPDTKVWRSRSGDFGFLRHERAAAPHLARVAERLRLSKRDHAVVSRLVRHHLLFAEQLATPAAIRRMLRRVGRDILDDQLELRRADLRSRLDAGPAAARELAEWERAEGRIRDLQRAEGRGEPGLAIGGQEVMEALGIGAGPEVGRWLRRLRRRVTDQPGENRRERLLAWLRATARAEDG